MFAEHPVYYWNATAGKATIFSGDANPGTVTSVTLESGTGITVSNSGTPIETSGTRTISLNVSGARTALGLKSLAYVEAEDSGDVGKYLKATTDSDAIVYEWVTPPDTNYYHTSGSWSGLTYTATANGGAGALAFTLPTGTGANQVALGNHTHAWDSLTRSSTTAGQVIVSKSTANQWELKTLGDLAYISAGPSDLGKWLTYDT